MTKQEKIKEGTILIATDVCKMSGCDEEVLTIDKEYRVISVDYEKREFVIIDDELSEHYFDIEDYAVFFKLHNNGWVKIESEDDNPKYDGNYFVIDNDSYKSISIQCYYGNGSWDCHLNITHYHPIPLPKPPIY